EEIDQKLNGMLSLINSATATGSVSKLTDEMKQMANNILLPYAFRGDVPKGIRFNEVLDEFGLHETRTDDDLRMSRAMGATLYDALKKEYAPDKEYLHVEDLKNVTSLDCAGMGVVDLNVVLQYMPSVTRVDASENAIDKMLIPVRGTYILSNGTVSLDTLVFRSKAIALDLKGTTINQNVLDAALKNVVTNLRVSSPGQWTIDEASNKLGELTISGSVNIYSCNMQTLKLQSLYLIMHGDLDKISISNLKLDRNVTPSIIFKSADVALKFLADWSKGNFADQRFNMVLLGGNKTACDAALEGFNTEAKAGRGFSDANKQLAIDAIIDCVAKGNFASGAKFDDMLKELGFVAKESPYEVYITSIGNKSTAITLLRNHCGYPLLEAKAMCDNLPATASGFNTRADAEALRKDIVTAGGGAIILADASIAPEPVSEERGYEVVLLGVGTSKLNVVKAVRDVCGLTLAEANTLCGSAPVVIATDKTESEAQAIKSAIDAVGGSAQVNAPLNAPSNVQKITQKVVLKSVFNVVLTSVGTNRLNVVKAVKESCGMSLTEANTITKTIPVVIASDKSQDEAEAIKSAIELAGGTASLE
ncbi:MAG: ribosomal protein L7/L12, partial [Bacteroidaceae bacterium]|nr:ribosomal protein L7/L12 [Bacteroidaceae bacterium]